MGIFPNHLNKQKWLAGMVAGMAFLLTAVPTLAADTNALALIPLPQQVQQFEGAFRLTPETKIYADFGSRATAKQLAARLRQATGYPLPVHVTFWAKGAIANGIFLTTREAGTNFGAEGYELTVTTNAVVIRAATTAGLFYGSQTLAQLLPPEIFSTNLVTGTDWQAPCVEIQDWPRFKWRGLMLDVSRHFYNKEEVEKILDVMAVYKLNTFHWHLVDNQGWRIEIKKYPKLTEIGAWRPKSVIEPPTSEITATPEWAQPTADKFDADGRYGGYYTQRDIREVVAYAAARHILVVPEIEMPGHSAAALAAYPELSCSGVEYPMGETGPHKRGVYCAGNDETFTFLQNVLLEVMPLFPGPYIHIGGDEVDKKNWRECEKCQARIKDEGLKNEDELQSYFIRRMEKFVNAHGRTLIGWSEITKGGLATNAVVMDWIGGGREAAKAGHDVVMSPSPFCYLDHYQSTNHTTEPRAIGGFLPLQKIYAYEPVPTNLPAASESHILGAQGNLWTEYVASLAQVEYMIFPRECALSEVDWSAKGARDWDSFQQRLGVDEVRLGELGVNYRQDQPILAQTIYDEAKLEAEKAATEVNSARLYKMR